MDVILISLPAPHRTRLLNVTAQIHAKSTGNFLFFFKKNKKQNKQKGIWLRGRIVVLYTVRAKLLLRV